MVQNPHNRDDYTDADVTDEYTDEYADPEYDDSESSDEWVDDESFDDAGSPADEPAPPKKKSNLLLFVIIGVVIVAAGGFFMLSAGGKKGSPQDNSKQPNVAAGEQNSLDSLRSNTSPDAVVAQPKPVVADPSKPQGFMDDQSLLNAPQQPVESAVPQGQVPPAQSAEPASTGTAPVGSVEQPAVPAQPSLGSAPAPSLVNVDPPQDPLAQSAAAVPEQPQDFVQPDGAGAPVQPVSDFPTADQALKAESASKSAAEPAPEMMEQEPAPDAVSEPVQEIVAAQEPVPAQEPAPALDNGVLEQAQNRIAELEKSLAEKDTALKQQEALASDVDTLRSKIIELEDRLADAQTHGSSSDQTSVPVVKASKPRVTSKAVQKPKSAGAATSSPASRSAAQWVLKGAQPGKALVALKGSNDLKTVMVGATLPGIGRITAIDQTPAGWVVSGTQGSIRQ